MNMKKLFIYFFITFISLNTQNYTYAAELTNNPQEQKQIEFNDTNHNTVKTMPLTEEEYTLLKEQSERIKDIDIPGDIIPLPSSYVDPDTLKFILSLLTLNDAELIKKLEKTDSGQLVKLIQAADFLDIPKLKTDKLPSKVVQRLATDLISQPKQLMRLTMPAENTMCSSSMLNILTLTGHIGTITTTTWSHDGTHIATASYRDGTVHIWNTYTGKIEHTLKHPMTVGFGGVKATWSPDGKYIATTSKGDNTCIIWNASTGTLKYTLKGHISPISSAKWSPDGTHIVTVSQDGTARIWNISMAKTGRTLTGHTNTVLSAEWSPDGQHIATASWDNTARIWNASTGQLEHTLIGHTDIVYSAEWSPDGQHIVTASQDNTARIWNSSIGQLERILKHDHSVSSAKWSPDGQYIVTASKDGNARIWNASTGELKRTLQYDNSVVSAEWSPDGQHIATAAQDNTARVWNASTGELEHTLRYEGVISATWSPDGHHIAIGTHNGTVLIWTPSFNKLSLNQLLIVIALRNGATTSRTVLRMLSLNTIDILLAMSKAQNSRLEERMKQLLEEMHRPSIGGKPKYEKPGTNPTGFGGLVTKSAKKKNDNPKAGPSNQ